MKSTDAAAGKVDRLPYVKPVLKTYGPVAAITNANDMKGSADGGPNNSRT